MGEAIEGGQVQIISLLLAEPLISVNYAGFRLASLVLALRSGKEEISEMLLANNNNESITSREPESGAVPLHIAIEKHFNNLVIALVERLTKQAYENPLLNLLIRDNKDMGALDVAATYNNRDAFDLLLKKIKKVYEDKYGSAQLKQFLKQLLFRKEGYRGVSVFALAYLPVPSESKIVNKVLPFYNRNLNTNMFYHVLRVVKDALLLSEEDECWNAICKEVEELYNQQSISLSYSKELHRLIASIGYNRPLINLA